jgi:hypothetical protein
LQPCIDGRPCINYLVYRFRFEVFDALLRFKRTLEAALVESTVLKLLLELDEFISVMIGMPVFLTETAEQTLPHASSFETDTMKQLHFGSVNLAAKI